MSVLNGKEKGLLRGDWVDQKYDSLETHTQTNKSPQKHKTAP